MIRIDLHPELHQVLLLMISIVMGRKIPDAKLIESMTLEVAMQPPESVRSVLPNVNSAQLYFAKHGATLVMMMDYFSLSRREAASLIRTYGHEMTTGRCQMPDLGTRDAIHRSWADITTYCDEMERLQALHMQFSNWSLRTLHAVVHEFEGT